MPSQTAKKQSARLTEEEREVVLWVQGHPGDFLLCRSLLEGVWPRRLGRQPAGAAIRLPLVRALTCQVASASRSQGA